MPAKKANKKIAPAKITHGGARPGAGRTRSDKIGNEKKETATIRLLPSQRAAMTKKYTSVQKGYRRGI